ncbi:hypothetical protein [Sulfurisoma sediminicola]|uniref:Uncharacterized protein n=1 Tax=Sulfurisoma sediminicola TaxID=1381557 RepID=A0A497XD58_9PROT|nr:hypothetical protein [Sulfurisoma sediminicola]RLJ64893.1 hypothetical protein DFR35_1542 [Sulfurisoma sediminicola]
MNDATQIPDELFPPPVKETRDTIPTAVADAANLMPYEKVAKAIFVKANGLPAYHRANRFVRYTD